MGSGRLLAAVAALAIALGACRDNSFAGTLTPVPAVHRIPPFADGTTILIAEDPVIETRDPEHVRRANENNVPRDYRVSMVQSLKLAGFKVTENAADAHDLRARLALAVSEESSVTGAVVRQVYRCGLSAPDGKLVAQVDWTWPQGTFVDINEVFDFATHSLTTEIATSRAVMTYLRTARSAPPAAPTAGPAGASGHDPAPDAGARP